MKRILLITAGILCAYSTSFGQCATPFDNYLEFAEDQGWFNPTTGVFAGLSGPLDDLDGDGLTNFEEFEGWESDVLGPTVWFSYNSNNVPFECGPDLLEPDTDGDGLTDDIEKILGYNPYSADSDLDLIPDNLEDEDGDGLFNFQEVALYGTDPSNADTDDDGVDDKTEVDQVTNPLHPMSVYDTNTVYGDRAQPRSLDLANVLPLGGGVPVPHPERFAFSPTNGWTIEGWVYLDGDSTGEIFSYESASGDSIYVTITNGTPQAAIVNYTGGVEVVVGGPLQGGSGVSPIQDNRWTYVGIAFSPVDNSFRLYRDGVLLIARNTLYLLNSSTNGMGYVGRGFDAGYIDELRVWNRVREADEISLWFNQIYPAPGYVDQYTDGTIPPLGTIRYNDLFYHVRLNDIALLPLYREMYEYGQPLVLNYRFDDFGDFIEDFAFLGDTNYWTTGAVTTVESADLQGQDDEDGDDLAEWWVEINDLDRYRERNIGPYHVLSTSPNPDYPVSFPNGWGAAGGTAGRGNRIYYRTETQIDTNGQTVLFYNVWQDNAPELVDSNGAPIITETYSGRGTYEAVGPFADNQIWADAGTWFVLDGDFGFEGVRYRDADGSQNFEPGEDLWLDVGDTALVYDAPSVTGIRYYRTFISHNSLGVQTAWFEDNRYISTKNSAVGIDGNYSTFHKYFRLIGEPSVAEMELILFGVDGFTVNVNGSLYEYVPDLDGVNTVDPEYTNLVSLLQAGRNKIYIVTTNTVTTTISEGNVHYEADYDRETASVKFDMSLMIDGREVIRRGDESVADPSSVWHGDTWSFWVEENVGTVLPFPDMDLFGHQHPDFGIPRDVDDDDLDNYYETLVNTNPRDGDTDNDGTSDGEEDYDSDGLVNEDEQVASSDPLLPDTDDDGLGDGVEALSAITDSLNPISNRVLRTDGSATNFMEFPVSSRYSIEEWTLEAYVRPDAGWGGGGTIMRRNVATNRETFVLSITTNLQPQVSFNGNVLTGGTIIPADGTNWTHIAATFNSNGRQLRIFINGQLNGFLSASNSPSATGGGPVVQRVGENFAGAIDEVRIWSSVLDAATIDDQRETTLTGLEDGLVGYFRFDDGTNPGGTSANPAYDFGQVENFESSIASDWTRKWENAGSLRGGAILIGAGVINDPGPGVGDNDGDGLPNSWEVANGLDPDSADGDDGAYGDPDGDGLTNFEEYQAGTLPQNFDSDNDGINDYDDLSPSGQSYGILYDDGDGIDDEWEDMYPGFMDSQAYDADSDLDNDRWSALAEYLYEGVLTDTNGSNTIVSSTSPADSGEYPQPDITFHVQYKGANDAGSIGIFAYDNEEMNGEPVATLTIAPSNFNIQITYTTNLFDTGYLPEGDLWFLGFFDNDDSGTYDEGEPFGIAYGQPYHLGWGGLDAVEIGLTDDIPGYLRAHWEDDGSSAFTVTVTRTTSAGAPIIFRKVIEDRNFVHEGDFQERDIYGLSAGLSFFPAYAWYVNGQVTSFSFNWASQLSKPTIVYPNGHTLRTGRNLFRWNSDPETVTVEINLYRGSPFTSPIMQLKTVPSPYLKNDGSYELDFPYIAGSSWFTNDLYYWRIKAKNPIWTSEFSDYAPFTVQATGGVATIYTVAGDVVYDGQVTLGDIIVQAYASRGYSERPSAEITIPGAGDFHMGGLLGGTYFIRAFIDMNGNDELDEFEPLGVYRPGDAYSSDLTAAEVVLPPSQSGFTIVIRDRDANNDNLSDAFVYQYGDLPYQYAPFDGDLANAIGIYHPQTGNWQINKETGQFPGQLVQFGWSQAVPVPGDYDGDGLRDPAVYHQAGGTWYIRRSSDGATQVTPFGWFAADPVPADYDGDGKTDLAVYHGASGTWYIWQSASQTLKTVQYGWSAPTPVPADYDGDGKADIALYHAPLGMWYIIRSTTGSPATTQYGFPGTKPVPADYDGDGFADIAVYAPSTGLWYIHRSSFNSTITVQWGFAAANPVPADYDTDGSDDIAVYHPASGNWYIVLSGGGQQIVNWGWSEAVPITSDVGLFLKRRP